MGGLAKLGKRVLGGMNPEGSRFSRGNSDLRGTLNPVPTGNEKMSRVGFKVNREFRILNLTI